MIRRHAAYLQGLVCVAALVGGFPASAQQPAPPMPSPMPSPVLAVPARPAPALVEERPDPFSPPLTDVERRSEEDRRIRDIVRPLVDQMREGMSQTLGSQIQDALKNSQQNQPAPLPGQPGVPGQPQQPGIPGVPGDLKNAQGAMPVPGEKPPTEAEAAEDKDKQAYEKALAMSLDPDIQKRQEGRARLEQIRRGQMPRWSSSEGVFFIGCINKRKMYRDKYGLVFESEFWYNGSSGTGGAAGSTGGAGVSRSAGLGQQAARVGGAPQADNRTGQGASVQQASATGTGTGSSSLAVDPCSN